MEKKEHDKVVKWTKKHYKVKKQIETLENAIPDVVTFLEETVEDNKGSTSPVTKKFKAKLIEHIKEKTKTCSCSSEISEIETWINEHEEKITPTELVSGTINEMISKLEVLSGNQEKEDGDLKEKIVTMIKG